MRTIYIFFILSTIYSCKSIPEKSNKLTGFLLMSPWRTHQSFDVFLPCNIDTSISLKENLKGIKKDTAFQTYGGNFAFDSQIVKLRNQAFDDSFSTDLKYTLLLPISAEYDTSASKLFKDIETKELYRMPYTFKG